MKKNLRSLFVFFSIAISASAVIIACGDGAPEIIDDWFRSSVLDGSEDQAIANIDRVVDSIIKVDGPDGPSSATPSSSSAPPPSSGSQPSSTSPGQSSDSPSSTSPGTSSSSPTQSSSSAKSSSTPTQSASGCKENDPKSGFTCGWSISGSSTTPGQPLTHAAATPPSGCTIAEWKYFDDDDPMTAIYGCTKLPEAGITTEGQKKYFLFAELTCSDGKHTTACNPKTGWSSKIAPKLEGDCEWDKNPISAKRGATPSGVKLTDPDIVCGGSGTKNVVYKYDGDKPWPTGEVPPATYSDVHATVNNCPGLIPTTCPALVANAGSDHQINLDCKDSGGQWDKCKGKNEATLKVDECVDLMVENYSGDARPAKISCSVGQGGSGSANVTLKGKQDKIENYYKAIDAGSFTSGENDFGTLCLVSGGPTITCKIEKH